MNCLVNPLGWRLKISRNWNVLFWSSLNNFSYLMFSFINIYKLLISYLKYFFYFFSLKYFQFNFSHLKIIQSSDLTAILIYFKFKVVEELKKTYKMNKFLSSFQYLYKNSKPRMLRDFIRLRRLFTWKTKFIRDYILRRPVVDYHVFFTKKNWLKRHKIKRFDKTYIFEEKPFWLYASYDVGVAFLLNEKKKLKNKKMKLFIKNLKFKKLKLKLDYYFYIYYNIKYLKEKIIILKNHMQHFSINEICRISHYMQVKWYMKRYYYWNSRFFKLKFMEFKYDWLDDILSEEYYEFKKDFDKTLSRRRLKKVNLKKKIIFYFDFKDTKLNNVTKSRSTWYLLFNKLKFFFYLIPIFIFFKKMLLQKINFIRFNRSYNKAFFDFYFIALKRGFSNSLLLMKFIINYMKQKFMRIRWLLKCVINFLLIKFNFGIILGFKFQICGRITKKDRALFIWQRFGKTSLNSKLAIIDFVSQTFVTKFSTCIVKLWVQKSKKKYY